jgi:hypothetical protein
MAWKFKPAKENFEGTRKDWDALNQARSNHLLLDSKFVSPLLRHFGPGDVTLGFNEGNGKPGMTLLERKRVGIWETFQPSQAPMGLIVFGYQDETGEGLLDLARALPGIPLELAVLQQDPSHTSLPPTQTLPNIERVDYISTPYLPIAGTFEDYWKARGTNLRHNLARRHRRMTEQKISMELKVRRAPEEVAECIREYGRLESKGWKGKDGTAIHESNAQGRFYQEMLENFCAAGEGVIYQWCLDDKVAASDLCLVRDGTMIVLKTAYDEELNQHSPALMMREEIMRQLHEQGAVKVVEFYGRVMEWHTKWCNDVRTMYHVNCFCQPWIRSARDFAAKFRRDD